MLSQLETYQACLRLGNMFLPKLRILQRIVDSGLVAVVRADGAEQAVRIAEACADGGVGAIEVTFTVPGAAAVVSELARRGFAHNILIGAGTVLDPETARTAILAGAQFVVAPFLNSDTVRLCNRYSVPYIPGAGTVREIVEAMEWGCDITKVFPGEILGPAFIKSVRGPLPHACLMPTGNVTLGNVAEWIRAGCVAVGVGGNLTGGAKRGDFQSIIDLSRQFIARIREAREAQ